MNVELLIGQTVLPYIPELARLRIEVFREYPYLYDGAVDYESEYLSAYAASKQSCFVLAMVGGKVCGVATGLPMEDAAAPFQKPFLERGDCLEDIFYFGESVLQPAYRGLGIGKQFLLQREAYARSLQRRCAVFCAVIRPLDHPLRPDDYRPLDAFWQTYGYQQLPGMTCQLNWATVPEGHEHLHTLQFWCKALQ